MAADTFTPEELRRIASLSTHIAAYNQHSDLFGEVRFYRKGLHVATLTEASGDIARRDPTELMLGVEEDAL